MILDRYKTIGIGSDETKLKLAAIFFDKVYNTSIENNVPKSLIAESHVDKTQFLKILENFTKKISTDYNNVFSERHLPKYSINFEKLEKDKLFKVVETVANDYKDQSFDKLYNFFSIEAAKQLTKEKTIGIPIFNETIFNDHLEHDYLNNSSQEKVEIKILNAPIIRVSDLEWEQIAEAKKDFDFNNKVKRFGVFINKNYKGRDIDFIIDDLSIQIEDYKSACKKHGIGLANETFKSLANSKSIIGTLGISLCALLVKMPEYAILTSTVGASLELLNLGITIRQYEDKFESFVNESPVSLIFEIDKLNVKNQSILR